MSLMLEHQEARVAQCACTVRVRGLGAPFASVLASLMQKILAVMNSAVNVTVNNTIWCQPLTMEAFHITAKPKKQKNRCAQKT